MLCNFLLGEATIIVPQVIMPQPWLHHRHSVVYLRILLHLHLSPPIDTCSATAHFVSSTPSRFWRHRAFLNLHICTFIAIPQEYNTNGKNLFNLRYAHGGGGANGMESHQHLSRRESYPNLVSTCFSKITTI